jgi:hypothetical protein
VTRAEVILEFVGRHVDVAESLAKRADRERAVAVRGHGGVRIAACEQVVEGLFSTPPRRVKRLHRPIRRGGSFAFQAVICSIVP